MAKKIHVVLELLGIIRERKRIIEDDGAAAACRILLENWSGMFLPGSRDGILYDTNGVL